MSASTPPRPSPATSAPAGPRLERSAHAELEIALEAIDQALADAPERNGHAFSRAITSLTTVRGALYAEDRRSTEIGRALLDRINAIISISLAGHFPLGQPPWEEIKKMRGWLKEIVEPE